MAISDATSIKLPQALSIEQRGIAEALPSIFLTIDAIRRSTSTCQQIPDFSGICWQSKMEILLCKQLDIECPYAKQTTNPPKPRHTTE
jgi:hypothetical protein